MICQNKEYKKFCAKFYRSLPCCQRVDKDSAFLSLIANNPEPQSLILQLFELGKLFAKKRIVKFTAQGTCMYPCIRQDDKIYIQPKNVQEIQVGEVAVYRRHSHLFSHRTIAKGRNEKGSFIITRPDTAKFGDDGPTFNKDILGVVANMERRGKLLAPVKKDYNLIEKIWFGLGLRCFYAKVWFHQKIIYLIFFFQQLKLYRQIAKNFPRVDNKNISFEISIPLHGKAQDKFYRKVSKEELFGLILNNGNSISKWIIALKINSNPVASLSFVGRPKTCLFPGWWLTEAKIRIRYRRTIIEKILLDKVCELLSKMKATKISVSVFKRAYLEQMFYRGLGFKKVDDIDDGVLKGKIKQPVKRIIMQKAID